MATLTKNRTRLMMGAGPMAIAMALTLAPQKANAQVQATESFVVGSGFRDNSGTDTIFLDSQTTVIDWTPDLDINGDALPFLPDGNLVVFESNLGTPDFAVLNRILPDAAGNIVQINGQDISQFNDISGTVTGGTVAFFSPTGIIVGNNAVFDVGSLILTSLEPNLASFTDFNESGGTLTLGDFANPVQGTSVTVLDGAQINALNEGSFFITAAPFVDMQGSSQVNGSQVFAGAAVVNLTLSNGLFDINIPVGTTDANGVVAGGTIGGPSSTGPGDNHIIYGITKALTSRRRAA